MKSALVSVKVFDSFSEIIMFALKVFTFHDFEFEFHMSTVDKKVTYWPMTIEHSVRNCMQSSTKQTIFTTRKRLKVAKSWKSFLKRPSTALMRPLHSIETVVSELEITKNSGEF
jgi:hypothetical protein